MSQRPESPLPVLPLADLAARHPGLTLAIAAAYAEAASVCLGRHHVAPLEIAIDDVTRPCRAIVEWPTPDDRTCAAWANEIDTTEAGAYAVVLAAAELAHELFAIRRAETLTGADYYIAPHGAQVEDLEHCLRLEVSGVDAGTDQAVRARLRSKVNQTRAGNSNLPAMAGVVGFKARLVAFEAVGAA